ncbi:MAG TPA: hypothetical protein VHQ41_00145 [Patescibacteria group bacterium]|jgi:hypothetical protein|nr:hypothetical protein [Patescibacteria group bacterium]
MAEINLLHGDQQHGLGGSFTLRVVARMLLLIMVAAVFLYAAMFFYNWRTSSQLTSVNQQVQAIQAEALANKDRNELVTRQEQLIQLETLISNHVYWSYLLPELARVTLKSAKYTNIEAKSDGKLNLSVSLPNYSDVEKYMQIFDLPEYNQQFSNVRIVGIDTVQNDTTISTLLRLELNFNPDYIKGRL